MTNEEMQKLEHALLKKALGFQTSEQVCEYAISENGDQVLCKKKLTKKHVPPDLNALKMLFDRNMPSNLQDMSDAELNLEREKLLRLIKEEEDADRKMQQTDEM